MLVNSVDNQTVYRNTGGMNHLVRDDYKLFTGRKACEETRHRSDHLCAGFFME